MKYILFLSFIFLSANLFGQDWALFPYKQKSYFIKSTDTSQLFLFYQDSARTEGDDTFYFFNRINAQNIGDECYTTVAEFVNETYWEGDFDLFLDSLVYRNDTLFYFDESSSLPFYFLGNALVGTSWVINSDYPENTYPDILITCDSVLLKDIFGIMDSVKYFSISTIGAPAGESLIDNYQIILSKNHGLIEFSPTKFFLQHPIYVMQTYNYLLKGFKTETENHGLFIPS